MADASEAYAKRLVAVLARERKRQGISHEAIAQAAGVHRSTISRTEGGQIPPNLLVLHAMATVLKLSFSQVAKEAEQSR